MQIYGVSFDMVGKQPIVLLKTTDGNRFLPIWIGHPEAAAILMKLQGASTPRPMTHDLLADVLENIDAKCERVSVTELRDNTFFATITLSIDGSEVEIDSRPSDALALAVRCDWRRSSPPRRSSRSPRSSSSTRSRTRRRSSRSSRTSSTRSLPRTSPAAATSRRPSAQTDCSQSRPGRSVPARSVRTRPGPRPGRPSSAADPRHRRNRDVTLDRQAPNKVEVDPRRASR